MKRSLLRRTGTVLGASTAIAIVVLSIWYVIAKTDPTVSASIIGAFATITVASLTVTLGRYFERLRQIEAQQHERRAEMYTKFFNHLMDSIGLNKPAGQRVPVSDEKAADVMGEFVTSAMTWASPSVIRAVANWRKESARLREEGDTDPIRVFEPIEDLIRAIRLDLGHRDGHSLPKFDVMRMFVNDFDSMLKKGS